MANRWKLCMIGGLVALAIAMIVLIAGSDEGYTESYKYVTVFVFLGGAGAVVFLIGAIGALVDRGRRLRD